LISKICVETDIESPRFITKTIMQKLETQVNNNLKQEKHVRDR